MHSPIYTYQFNTECKAQAAAAYVCHDFVRVQVRLRSSPSSEVWNSQQSQATMRTNDTRIALALSTYCISYNLEGQLVVEIEIITSHGACLYVVRNLDSARQVAS